MPRALLIIVFLAGCAPVIEEAVVLEEPILAEPTAEAGARPPDACDATGDDGIGGTGCPQDP